MTYLLTSVKCLIEAETLFLYAQQKDWSFVKWKHLDDLGDSFFNRLSDYDFGTLETLIYNR